GLVCWIAYKLPPPSTSDFDQVWVAARALLAGQDPYAVVPIQGTHYPFLYPLPAALIAVPVAWVPVPTARVLWAVVSGTLFAWAALRHGRGLPPALLSASFLNAVIQGQWSPLLTAAAALPALSWIYAAKPTIGAALFAAFPSRRALVGGAALVLLATVVMPSWPLAWWTSVDAGTRMLPYPPIVARPAGALLLLALARWRQPEGRLLAGLACVPQTLGLYETLPLFLLARTRWQGYVLACLSYLAAFLQVALAPRLADMSLDRLATERWPVLFACLYLPALLMVIMPPRRGERQGM
ncbi:MAG TPA: hypothetical protein VFH51_11895, partial [Myxococcota bacterium]|nr:hypothetical protein [Myxococcota bacterium]